jgi:hypothetical protein
VSSSRATEVRLRWPPESLEIRVSAWLAQVRVQVVGEPQLGCEPQRLPDGQLVVDHVILGHDPDTVPQVGVVRIQVAPGIEHLPAGGGPCPREGAQQG